MSICLQKFFSAADFESVAINKWNIKISSKHSAFKISLSVVGNPSHSVSYSQSQSVFNSMKDNLPKK